MKIQIRQIKGDIVELVFNPKEEDLRVGETLSLREKASGRGVIVQIIEFRTVTYPSLLLEMLQQVADGSAPPPADLPPVGGDGLGDMSNLKVAIAKIRKVVQWPVPMAEIA